MSKKTLYIDDNIHTLLKVVSQFEGTTMGRYVEKLLEETLLPKYNQILAIHESLNNATDK